EHLLAPGVKSAGGQQLGGAEIDEVAGEGAGGGGRVDGDGAAGDQAAVVAEQHRDGAGHPVGIQGGGGGAAGLPVGAPQRAAEGGGTGLRALTVDAAQQDGVDVDVVLGVFHRQGAGEVDDARLGAVVGHHVGEADDRVHGGDIHDAAATLRAHLRQRVTAHEEEP